MKVVASIYFAWMENNIRHRAYRFSLTVIKFLREGKWDAFSLVIVKQLMRSSSSITANLVEAQNSTSSLEFKRVL